MNIFPSFLSPHRIFLPFLAWFSVLSLNMLFLYLNVSNVVFCVCMCALYKKALISIPGEWPAVLTRCFRYKQHIQMLLFANKFPSTFTHYNHLDIAVHCISIYRKYISLTWIWIMFFLSTLCCSIITEHMYVKTFSMEINIFVLSPCHLMGWHVFWCWVKNSIINKGYAWKNKSHGLWLGSNE